MRKTIIQASDLKEDLEKRRVNKLLHTLASLDAIDMYPSINFDMVKKAADHFSKTLPAKDKETIVKCLEMIEFGMSNTLITFLDKYYKYGTLNAVEDKRLTIGGYESAWLADLVAAFILNHTTKHFLNTEYFGIYRDDGFIVFNSVLTKKDLVSWLKAFQATFDKVCGCTNLQYTAELWGKEDELDVSERVKVMKQDFCSYLDMEMR